MYLKKPSYVPQAYEQAIAEIVRRRRFRQVLNQDVEKLKDFIAHEKLLRQKFTKEVHTYLPSQFLPQLRDGPPSLILEGSSNELDLPNLEDAINPVYLQDAKVDSPFSAL